MFLFQQIRILEPEEKAKPNMKDPLTKKMVELGLGKGDFFVLYENTKEPGNKKFGIYRVDDIYVDEKGNYAIKYLFHERPFNSHLPPGPITRGELLTSDKMNNQMNGAYIQKLTANTSVWVSYDASFGAADKPQMTQEKLKITNIEHKTSFLEHPYIELTFEKKTGNKTDMITERATEIKDFYQTFEPIMNAPKKEDGF